MAIAQIAIKNELAPDQSDDPEVLAMLEARILEMCQKNLKGITEKTIKEDQPDLSPNVRMKAINRLLAGAKLELCKQGSTLVYRLKEFVELNSELSAGLRSLDVEQLLVYKTLEAIKGKGYISTDVRKKTSLPQVQVTKILKHLESQGLVQTVKLPDLTGVKSKVYLLSGFEPDESLINRERLLSVDELDQLFQHIHKLLLSEREANRKLFFSSEDILGMKTAHIPLSFSVGKEKLDMVLQALCDEGKLDSDYTELPDETGTNRKVVRFRAKEINLAKQLATGISFAPCVMCHLIDRCQDIGNVSPNSCLYLNDWLKF